jgi:crotonobetainyl-CoA:carnitine CoA-transferase CaiB-like acyl-CoA transferase
MSPRPMMFPSPGVRVIVSSSTSIFARPTPGLGEHTEELLREIGYDGARIGTEEFESILTSGKMRAL